MERHGLHETLTSTLSHKRGEVAAYTYRLERRNAQLLTWIDLVGMRQHWFVGFEDDRVFIRVTVVSPVSYTHLDVYKRQT